MLRKYTDHPHDLCVYSCEGQKHVFLKIIMNGDVLCCLVTLCCCDVCSEVCICCRGTQLNPSKTTLSTDIHLHHAPQPTAN